MNQVIVIGAGGHAKVCIDILKDCGYQVVYVIRKNDDPDDSEYFYNVPIEYEINLAWIKDALGIDKAFVAIGDNKIRVKLSSKLNDMGFTLVNAISSKAIISGTVLLGKGIAVMPGAIINADTVISRYSIINTGATIDHECKIKKGVHIAPGCNLAGNVIVGSNSFLGIGTKVIPNINIGENVIIGAGSTVIDNIPDNSKVVGSPARKYI